MQQHDQLIALLARARVVLERHLYDEDGSLRDDVAQVCMDIDDIAAPSDRGLLAAEVQPLLLQQPVAA